MNWDESVFLTRSKTRSKNTNLEIKKKKKKTTDWPQILNKPQKKTRILYASLFQIWTDRPPDHYRSDMGLKNPAVNKKEAETKFKQISEAYSVLSDTHKHKISRGRTPVRRGE